MKSSTIGSDPMSTNMNADIDFEHVDDPGEIVQGKIVQGEIVLGGGIVPGDNKPGIASPAPASSAPDPAHQFIGRRLELFEAASVAISLSDVSSVQCYSSSSSSASASPRQTQGFCQVFLRSGSNPTIDLKLSRALIRAVVEHYAPQFCPGGPEIWLFETASGVIVLSDVVFARILPPQADGAWSCLVLLRSGESSTIDGRFGADLIQALKNHIAFGRPR